MLYNFNNHSTKVRKNSYIRLVRYTIPARGHQIQIERYLRVFIAKYYRTGISTPMENSAHAS